MRLLKMSRSSKVAVSLAALLLIGIAIACALNSPGAVAWLTKQASSMARIFGERTLSTPAPAIASQTETFDLVALAKKARVAVVSIEVFGEQQRPVAIGSGFFVSDDGLLVTNYHVIAQANSAVAKTSNGDSLGVKGAVYFDRDNDLAVLKADGQHLRFASGK